MKASPADIRAAIARPNPAIRLYLFFGPDEAGSAALAKELVGAFGDDAERVDLNGSELKADPARLADEAASLSLFGSSRVIRVQASGEEALAACETLLAAPVAVNPVVMINSGISDKARIAKLALADKAALALMSYPPRADDMAGLVATMAREAGLRLDPAMAHAIGQYTGANRRLAEMEVEKLALYLDATPDEPKTVEWSAITALGAASEDDAMGPIIAAALGGDVEGLPNELRRMREQGVSEVGLVIALQRQVMQLVQLAAKAGGRGSVDQLVDAEFQARRLFGDRRAYKRQLRCWSPRGLARLTERLLELQQRMMRASPGAELLLAHELTEIARVAARGA